MATQNEAQSNRTTSKFIKLIRVEENPNIELLIQKHHNEFILLTIIAMRARRLSEDCKFTKLSQNQAMIGDFRNYGMSERNYRTAKKNLEAWGFATFKGTFKGTVATLSDSSIYDINPEQGDGLNDSQPTDKRRTPDERPTTKKNVNNEKKVIPFTETEQEFFDKFKKESGKNIRTLDDKTRRQLRDRLTEGYTVDDIISAVTAMVNDEYHKSVGLKHLSTEFVTRGDKLQKWASASTDSFIPWHINGRTAEGTELCNGLTRKQHQEKYGRLI